jgi:hypothetical protein
VRVPCGDRAPSLFIVFLLYSTLGFLFILNTADLIDAGVNIVRSWLEVPLHVPSLLSLPQVCYSPSPQASLLTFSQPASPSPECMDSVTVSRCVDKTDDVMAEGLDTEYQADMPSLPQDLHPKQAKSSNAAQQLLEEGGWSLCAPLLHPYVCLVQVCML